MLFLDWLWGTTSGLLTLIGFLGATCFLVQGLADRARERRNERWRKEDEQFLKDYWDKRRGE